MNDERDNRGCRLTVRPRHAIRIRRRNYTASRKKGILEGEEGSGMGLSRSLAFEFEWVSSCNGD